MSFALLTKVAGMSTAVSTTLGSFVYYSAKDTKLKEHLLDIKSKDEKIKNLKEQKELLSQQLGIARGTVYFRVFCNDEDLPIETYSNWNGKPFELSCKASK